MAKTAEAHPEQQASTGDGDHKSTLISARVFECYSPPPINTISGAIVPRIFTKHRRRRKISVEVHRVEQQLSSSTGQGALKRHVEECIVRVLDPITIEERLAARARARARRHGHDHEDDDDDDDDDGHDDSDHADDDGSLSGSPYSNYGAGRYSTRDFDKGWAAKYTIPLRAITIKGTHKTGVLVQVSSSGSSHKQVRELIFDTMEDADLFQNTIKAENAKERHRAMAKAEAVLGGAAVGVTADETIQFLVEIVSAWDIPAADFTSSDPFVKCTFEGQEVHSTKYISKSLDPIWTLKTDSLFIFTVSVKDLFLSEHGLVCTIYDYDQLGKNDKLGKIAISPKELFDAKGERMEYKLLPCHDGEETSGCMAVRCRRASDYDINFLKEYKESEGSLLGKKKWPDMHLHAPEGVTGKGNIASMISKRSRIAKDGRNAGKREYKVRPGSDPKRPEETTWLTADQLMEESMEESRSWVDIGSGSIGRLFVEVLGCDDLPNLDTGGFAGNKTDTFVSVVYEDAVVRTDVIDDCCSPRWMPWSQRAFVFRMMHSSSQLFLGAFDYDAGLNPADDHDLIGRVSVDVSNLRKDTTYILRYTLCSTAKMSLREEIASVTIRLRLEIEDERKMLLSNLEPPPQLFVNQKKRRDFRCIRYTCTGKYNVENYSMRVINSYIEELLALQNVVFYIEDGIIALLMWRGTFPIQIGEGEPLKLPIHSLTAFLIAISVVERPQLIPSVCFGCVGWGMLALNGYRRRLPDAWSQCKSFKEFVEVLVFGESQTPPHSIEAYENHEEAQKFLENWKKRISDAEKQAAKAYEESVKQQEEYEREMEEVDESTDISTKRGGVSIDPFKPILFPLQQNLAMLCRYVRHAKYIAMWEECYISFWVTLGCLLLSFIFYFVPWFFLMKWCSRLLVWTIFGPWMKLVDIYYYSKIKPLSEEELLEKEKKERAEHRETIDAALSAARVKKENAAKLKAMKRHRFGKFIVRVPVLKEDRYRDLPLPESTAVPYKPPPRPLSELAMDDIGYKKIRLPGQHLVGDMIPRIVSPNLTEAPIGQATAHPKQMDKEGPGGNLKTSSDSTASAYATIATLILAASVLTWFGVPLLYSATEYALKLGVK